MDAVERAPAPASAPGRFTSFHDRCRYRSRLLRYALRYVSRPSSIDAIGLVLGIVGSGSAMAVVWSVTLGQPPWVRVGLVVLALLCVLTLAVRGLARTSRVLALAARDPSSVRRLQEDMREGITNDQAFAALAAVYLPRLSELDDDPAFRGSGRRFEALTASTGDCPALALVLPAGPEETLTDLLTPQWRPRPRSWSTWASRFADERQAFMRGLRGASGTGSAAVDDESGDNLVLDGITVDPVTGHLRLEVALATYGQMVRTSDALINEFALFAHLSRDRREDAGRLGRLLARVPGLRYGRPVELSPGDLLKELPWRRAVHRTSASMADLLLRPTGRAAGLGVAVTLVKREEGRLHAYVGRRSSAVGTYADVRHVIPAGMCNVKDDLRASGQPVRPDFLQWTMLGELLEECYNEEELAFYRTQDWVEHIRQHCAARGVSTDAPRFTGIAIDLLNLRPEVCAVLEVVDPGQRIPPEHFRLCWEYSPLVGIATLDLATAVPGCQRTDWVQSGIASLALAQAHTARTTSA